MDQRNLHSFAWIWSRYRVDLEFQEVTSVFCPPPFSQVLLLVKGQVGSETAPRTKVMLVDIIKAQ